MCHHPKYVPVSLLEYLYGYIGKQVYHANKLRVSDRSCP